jgi:hypothetical protein
MAMRGASQQTTANSLPIIVMRSKETDELFGTFQTAHNRRLYALAALRRRGSGWSGHYSQNVAKQPCLGKIPYVTSWKTAVVLQYGCYQGNYS